MSTLDLLHEMTADLKIQLFFILRGIDTDTKIYPELL